MGLAAEQVTQTSPINFCSNQNSNDASFKDFPFMSLLLQEHQQEKRELLGQSTNIRTQPPADSGSLGTSQFSSDLVQATGDECRVEPVSEKVRDMRTPLINTASALSDVRTHHSYHPDFFEEAVFGDEDQCFQQTEVYHGGCHPEHSIFRQYAPYIAEQQAVHTG